MTAAPFDISQYYSLRESCGVVELPGWSSISLRGADRQRFLHNFCTNDIKRLGLGESCEAFFTDVKGRILSHALVICHDQELVVLLPPDHSARLLEHLDRYLLRDDVQLLDSTGSRAFVVLTGSAVPQALPAACEELAPRAVGPITWPLSNSGKAALLEAAASAIRDVLAHLTRLGVGLIMPEAFAAARIEDGIPLYGTDFDDRNFPQEVGRDQQAISFTKGCYLGQETVARIDALGHVNQQLAGVRFGGPDVPPPGTELFRGETKVGRVTSATFSPRLRAPLALAMVRREANAVGTRLESPGGACEVVSLPVASSR